MDKEEELHIFYFDNLNLSLPFDESNSTGAPMYKYLDQESFSEASNVVNVSEPTPNGSERDEALVKIELAVLSTILILAVGGNACVLVALARRRKIVSRMHMFILHLSVADLLVAFFNILPQLAWEVTGNFLGGDVLCRFVKYMQVFVMYLSTYVLVMTAVDRYRAICHPLSNYNWSSRTVNAMIASAYILSTVFSIPQILLFKLQLSSESDEYDCWVDFQPSWIMPLYIISFTFAVYIIPFAVLVFTYGSICYTIWSMQSRSAEDENEAPNLEAARKEASNGKTVDGASAAATYTQTVRVDTVVNHVTKQTASSPSSKRVPNNNSHNHSPHGFHGFRNGCVRPRVHSVHGFSRAKLKTVKLTFVVIIAYLICWSPFFISQLWWMHDSSQGDNKAVVIMLLLASLNSCCNPWIYLAFSGNLLRHLLPCWSQKARHSSSCCWQPCRRHPSLFLTPTPTPSRTELPRGIEMIVMRKRRKEFSSKDGVGHSALAVRNGIDMNATLYSHKKVGRLESLTSLLTLRASLPQRQQSLRSDGCLRTTPDASKPAASPPVTTEAVRNGVHSPGACKTLPSVMSRQSSTGASLSNSSSSGSKPRSPHVFRHARLHVRPAEELAEAQLRWEQNIQNTGP